MSTNVGQGSQDSVVDVLKKHHSKSMISIVTQLLDPRAMAELQGRLLEDECSEAEVVCRSSYFSISLQLNTVMFPYIAGPPTKYGIAVALMPSANTVPVGQYNEEMGTSKYEMTYNCCE